MNLETLLYDELNTLYEKLRTLTPGSEEYKAVFNEVTKLNEQAIELHRIESEYEDKAAAREVEQAANQQKLADENVDRIVRNVITVAGIVVPLLVTIWGTKVCLKFEEEGTITTHMGRGFIQRLFPKK